MLQLPLGVLLKKILKGPLRRLNSIASVLITAAQIVRNLSGRDGPLLASRVK
jgi:hypothetical protein